MKNFYCLIVLCQISFISSAFAVEPLETSELLKRCENLEKNPESIDTALCRSYIHGYLGGAYAMRTVSVTDLPKKKSAFTERAMQHRTGGMDLRFGMNERAGYCLPQDLSIADFVVRMNHYSKDDKKHSELASQFVLEFLQNEFVCKSVKN